MGRRWCIQPERCKGRKTQGMSMSLRQSMWFLSCYLRNWWLICRFYAVMNQNFVAFLAALLVPIKNKGLGILVGLLGVRRRRDCWKLQSLKFWEVRLSFLYTFLKYSRAVRNFLLLFYRERTIKTDWWYSVSFFVEGVHSTENSHYYYS